MATKKVTSPDAPPAPPAAATLADIKPGEKFTIDGELHKLVHVIDDVYTVMKLEATKVRKSAKKVVEELIGVATKELPGDTPVEKGK